MTKDNRLFFSAGIIDKEDEEIFYYTLSQGEVAEYYSQLVDVDNFQEVYGEMTYPALTSGRVLSSRFFCRALG